MEEVRQLGDSLHYPKGDGSDDDNPFWTSSQVKGRRGDYTSVTIGYSDGQGQGVSLDHLSTFLTYLCQSRQGPTQLRIEERQRPIVERLLSSKAVYRIAGFANGLFPLFFIGGLVRAGAHANCTSVSLAAFATYAPKIYRHCADSLQKILDKYPDCEQPLDNTVFPTVTFNLGPQTVAWGHVDSQNAAQGFCPVNSAGKYDPKKGGHMVLLDLNLIIEFPPGSTILLPSSVVRHGNTPIAPHETRYSFTMFVPGPLLRWVHHGLQPKKRLSKKKLKELYGEGTERWMEALDMFSKIDEIEDDIRKCFGCAA